MRGDEQNLYQNCADGYTGVMCSACSDLNWKSLGNFECYACGSQDTGRNTVYAFKVLCFYLFVYVVGRVFLDGFSDPNSETLSSIKILLTFAQTMAIVSRMEATRTKISGEEEMQTFMDTLIYYTNPGEWLFDFDCLFLTSEDMDGDMIADFESIS